MPIYEFHCAKCGNLAEVVQRVGARPPPCPVCGSTRMTRAVSRTAFHLKGGGWYADLYSTPRPGADRAEGTEGARTKDEKSKDEKPKGEKARDEKPAAGSGTEGAGKPATAPAPPAAKAEAPSREGSSPPRRRPSPPRKRR
jgi:putative FmdB family regulatory protein